jgi:hypothetical protein
VRDVKVAWSRGHSTSFQESYMPIDVLGLVIAALGRTAVAVERQWSGRADGVDDARFAGVRTFTLLGGIAGWL